MQITKHPTKQIYVATQSINNPPTDASGVTMPSMYVAEGYTEMQCVMGVSIMISMMCIKYKIHPDKLELS